MDLEKLLTVLTICLPVFAMIAIGRLLAWRGVITEPVRSGVNWIVYHLSLPALIFLGVARQDCRRLDQWEMAVASLVPMLIVCALAYAVGRWRRWAAPVLTVTVFGTFCGNIAYLGFPLTESAFGEAGMMPAAVFNAAGMPGFLALSYAIIALLGGGGAGAVRQGLWRAVWNPVLGASVLGVVASIALGAWRGPDGALVAPDWAVPVGQSVERLLTMIGTTGLPLALLAIGAALHGESLRRYAGPLALVTAAKLIVLPGLCLLCFRWLLPDVPAEVLAVTVLLNAMPAAVTTYVIARQMGLDEHYASAMLVVGTLGAVLTLPAWLYVLL